MIFQKKLINQFHENYQKEGRIKGKTLIHWNLPAMTGGPKRRLGGIMVLIHNTLENPLIKTRSTQRKVKIKNMRLRNFHQIKFLSLDRN